MGSAYSSRGNIVFIVEVIIIVITHGQKTHTAWSRRSPRRCTNDATSGTALSSSSWMRHSAPSPPPDTEAPVCVGGRSFRIELNKFCNVREAFIGGDDDTRLPGSRCRRRCRPAPGVLAITLCMRSRAHPSHY